MTASDAKARQMSVADATGPGVSVFARVVSADIAVTSGSGRRSTVLASSDRRPASFAAR